MAWLGGGSLSTLSLALLLMQQPAFADGGGAFNSAGPGVDNPKNPGDPVNAAGGTGGNGLSFFGGGSGGGAGQTGGAGGTGSAQLGQGGVGGTSGAGGQNAAGLRDGGNGGDASGASRAGGGGGGGGAHGLVSATLPGVAVEAGGNGGAGGAGNITLGVGGGGGAGGYGTVITGTGALGALGVAITGGNGGDGGAGLQGAGSGGSGGVGLFFNGTAPTSFTVNAAVTGGDGGTRGVTGNIQGADGVGGAGLVGQNLTVTMGTGTIAGGLAGDGVTRANAITFTGGNNTISFGGLGTGLTGNIDVTGSLTFAQPAVAIVSNAITGSGSITKTQAGSIVLTGANTYSGGTTVDAGILAVTGAGTLGNISNAVTVSGGALDLGGTTQTQNGGVHLTGGSIVNGTLSSSGSFDLQSGLVSASLSGSGGVSKTTAGTVTLLSGNSYSGGTTITAGTLALSGAGTLGNTGSALIVTGGTLDLGGTSQTVGSLAGNGTVTTSAAGTSTLTVGGSTWTLFFGLIEDGAGQLRLTKAGTGTLSLMNANTYTGVTNLNGGTIEIANSAALGAAALVMSAGTTLRSSAAGLTLSNTIALAPSGTIDTSGNTMTLLGAISGGELTKAGAGTLILANNGNSHIDTKLNAGTIQVGSGGALGSGTLQMLNNTVLQSGAANLIIGNSIRFDAGGSNFTIDTQANTMTLSGIVFQQFGQMGAASTLVKTGSGTLVLSNANNNYTGGTNLTAGAIEVGNNGAVGSGALSMSDGTTLRSGALTLAIANNVGITGTATFDTTNGNFITLSGTVSGGALTKSGAGTLTLANANTYGGGTSLNAGSIEVRNSAALGTGALTMAGGALLAAGVSNLTLANDVIINGGIIQTDSNTLTLSGTLSGGGVYLKVGTGTLVLTGANTNSGGIDLAGGSIVAANDLALGTSLLFMNNGTTLRAGTASVSLANDVRIGGAEITFDTQANAMTLGGEISGGGAMVKNGTGTLTLMGNNTFTGNTTVNSGALIVNGSLASSALTTVNAGATLGGTGTVGNTTIDGGVLSPGNSIGTLTVSGNLIMTAAASYLLEVSPASADRTNVTGTATLGGATVHANFAPGAYVAKQYTILNATGGVNGTFSGLVNTNLPGGFKSSLSYDTNNAYLDLALAFVPPPGGGLSGNQQNVANAIVNFFNSNGSIPIVFGGLTPAGLTQISGETATGSQQATFNAMSQFMGVMTDPFIAGRGNPISSGGSPNAFADEEALAYAARGKSRSKSERDAYAAVYTKVPPLAPDFEQRWSIWGAGFGGSQRTDGNVVLGSNDTRSSIYGVAAGADYRFSPNTIAGFALAGGGTNFSVNGFGGGRSDLFQAGGFIRHNWGPAYVTGALAYGWQDITTDRTVTVAGIDRLRAQFNANAWSGRLEGGYRFVAQGFGWTPYAAGQFATFELPAYAEQVISGANTFALAYSAKSVTATRSELGLRTDKSFAVQDGIFTLRGRAAWAHNFNTDRGALPTFQALPGASFVVNGAAQAPDAALITGSAEMKWISGWSVSATFEGEFSNVTESYAGKGVVRYAW